MNGAGAAVLSPVARDIVALLERTLADARAGQVNSIALVVVPASGGVMAFSGGGSLIELIAGCEMAKAECVEKTKKGPRPAIVPARLAQ